MAISLLLETDRLLCQVFLIPAFLYEQLCSAEAVEDRSFAYGSAFLYGKCIFVFSSRPASSCGRKTHHQHSETLLCVFSFVNSNLNSVFHMTVQGIARGQVLGKLWFFVLLAGHVAWEWLQLHFQRPGGGRCGAGRGCRHTAQCLVQPLWALHWEPAGL